MSSTENKIKRVMDFVKEVLQDSLGGNDENREQLSITDQNQKLRSTK
jgi:hypothetical protein